MLMKIVCAGENRRQDNNGAFEPLIDTGCPTIYMKPDSCILRNRKPFFIPDHMGRIDFSCQLAVRINRLGKSISERFASRYWDAVTLGIDFVASDLKNKLAENGLPWDICCGFDGAAVIGDWIDKDRMEDIQNLDLRLDVDNSTIQSSNTCNMIHSVDSIIEYVSRFCTLKTGDIIFSGALNPLTEAVIGQHLQGYLNGVNVLDFHVR